jgi:tetratricopeptide (TPR) repeat protein
MGTRPYVNALLRHFHLSRDISDVSNALEAARQALAATDPKDSLWPGRANNLAAALSARFENSQSVADLDDAVRTYDEALALAPQGSPARARLLHGKGSTWRQRYVKDDEIRSLEESIRYFREAVDISAGMPERPLFLCDLGLALGTRFEELGNAPDLDQSIGRLSEAIEGPGGAPAMIQEYTGPLAIAYRTRYEQRGDREDLRRACLAFQSAWRRTSTADPGYSDALQRYGECLQRLVEELEAAPVRRDLRYELGQALCETGPSRRSAKPGERCPVKMPSIAIECSDRSTRFATRY